MTRIELTVAAAGKQGAPAPLNKCNHRQTGSVSRNARCVANIATRCIEKAVYSMVE